MKYNQITLSLTLVLSIGAQSLVAHGELVKFNVDRNDVGNCAKAKHIANIFAPTLDDLVENFGSDEKVAVKVPQAVASNGQVELSKKDLAKIVLIGADFIKKTQHNLAAHSLRHALLHAAKSVGYEVVKDQVIGFIMNKGGAQIEVPNNLKNSRLLAAATYAAGKAAGFGLSVAYEAGVHYVFHPR